jgi:hypothetical protein
LSAVKSLDQLTPEEEAKAKATLGMLNTIWPEKNWSGAQYAWLAYQAYLPEEQRQRAIKSVLQRTLAARGKR